MPGCGIRRTPGSNGAALSFCRTRHFIRLPNGAGLRFGGADVPAEQRLADLENSLVQVKLDLAENVPLLAPLLEIPLPQERALDFERPRSLRRRQLAALTGWVMVARAGPAGGAGVRRSALGRIRRPSTSWAAWPGAARLAPLFIVATTRPEFRPPWGMRSHHGTISLSPLRSPAGAADGGGALSAARAAARSGGGRSCAHRWRAAVRSRK